MVALSGYLALLTQTCLGLVGARSPTITERSFARNRDYLHMPASLRPEGVETALGHRHVGWGGAAMSGSCDAACD